MVSTVSASFRLMRQIGVVLPNLGSCVVPNCVAAPRAAFRSLFSIYKVYVYMATFEHTSNLRATHLNELNVATLIFLANSRDPGAFIQLSVKDSRHPLELLLISVKAS